MIAASDHNILYTLAYVLNVVNRANDEGATRFVSRNSSRNEETTSTCGALTFHRRPREHTRRPKYDTSHMTRRRKHTRPPGKATGKCVLLYLHSP